MNHIASERKFQVLRTAFAATAILILCVSAGVCQTQPAGAKVSLQSAEEMVSGLYGLVSATGGKSPDWDKVRTCFLKEAVIVLRTSRTATTTFSLEGFIKDFVDFYERPYKTAEGMVLPKDKGFREKVIRMKTWEYGDMAQILVLYEAQIIGITRPPQQGVDSWLLIRRDGRWLIAAATNEIVTPDRPVPPELRPEAGKVSAGLFSRVF